MENIVSGQDNDERLQLQLKRDIPKFRPQNVNGFAQNVSLGDGTNNVVTDHQGEPQIDPAPPADATVPYEQLVLGDMPQYQYEPQLGDWYAQQMQLQQAGPNQFNQRLEQLNQLPTIPQYDTQPSLAGYTDPRFQASLLARQQQIEQNVVSRANAFVNPEPPQALDPNRPDLVLRALPNLTPGSDAAGARRAGGYNPPIPNGWANWADQLSSLGHLISDVFQPQTALSALRGLPFNLIESSARLMNRIANNPTVRPGLGDVASTFAQSTHLDRPEVGNSLLNFLGTIAPAQTNPGAAISPYYFNPQRGYFGEMGRGLGGLALYGLSLPGQIAQASIYSMTDLGLYLAGRNPWEGVDPDHLWGVRYRQAFAGQDLGFTNFRDGSGRRYLAAIDPHAPVWQQWVQGALGFAGDAFGLGWVDDAMWDGLGLAARSSGRLRVPNFIPNRFPDAPEYRAVLPPTPVSELTNLSIPSSVPSTTFRTNSDLLEAARRVEFGGRPIVPPDVRRLSEDGRAMLQNVFGDTFARRGVPLSENPFELPEGVDIFEPSPTPVTPQPRVNTAPTSIEPPESSGGIPTILEPVVDEPPRPSRLREQLGRAAQQARETAASVQDFSDTTQRVSQANSAMLQHALDQVTAREESIRTNLRPDIAPRRDSDVLDEVAQRVSEGQGGDVLSEALAGQYAGLSTTSRKQVLSGTIADRIRTLNNERWPQPAAPTSRGDSIRANVGVPERSFAPEDQDWVDNFVDNVEDLDQAQRIQLFRDMIAGTGEAQNLQELTRYGAARHLLTKLDASSIDTLTAAGDIQTPIHHALVAAAQTGELPDNIVDLVYDYLRGTQNNLEPDAATVVARDLREVEQRMVGLHERLRNTQAELSGLVRYGRGHINDELENLLVNGDENPLPTAQTHTRGLLQEDPNLTTLQPDEAEALYLRVAPHADEVAQQFPELSESIQRINNWDSERFLRPSPSDMADDFPRRLDAIEQVRRANVPDEFKPLMESLADLGTASVQQMWRNATDEGRHAAVAGGLPTNLSPTVYGRTLPDVSGGQTYYHGSKINYDNFDNLHPEVGGSANELGSGLYLTTNPNIAELHALRGSNPTTILNPTRRVSDRGNVYTVLANPRQVLEGTERPPSNVRKAFYQAAADLLGVENPAFFDYKDATRNLPANRWWLQLRETVAQATGYPISEVDYRRFSANVAERLRRRGYDAIRNGETLVILDQPSRLPVQVTDVRRGIGNGTYLEATAAQAEADRLLRDSLPTLSTRTWAAQSALDYEDARLSELVDAHNEITANLPVNQYVNDVTIEVPSVEVKNFVQRDPELREITQNIDEICP